MFKLLLLALFVTAEGVSHNCYDATPYTEPVVGHVSSTEPTDMSEFEHGCSEQSNRIGVWYSVVGTGDRMKATTCFQETSFDNQLSIFSGVCESTESQTLACHAGSDDGCGMYSVASTVTFETELGHTYYIMVHGYMSNFGTFKLEISCEHWNCINRDCGENGCGGLCGSCSDILACDGGVCDADVDGDGYGVNERDEYGVNKGDCDDSDPNINPGEIEICGNDIDENCDGVDDICPPTNDIRAGATHIAPDSQTRGTTKGSTRDSRSNVLSCGDAFFPSHFFDAWFSLVGNGNWMVASTCHEISNFDTQLVSYESRDSGCGEDSLGCVDGNDDMYCGCKFGTSLSSIAWESVPGITYCIQVLGVAKGDFMLSLSEIDVSYTSSHSQVPKTAASAARIEQILRPVDSKQEVSKESGTASTGTNAEASSVPLGNQNKDINLLTSNLNAGNPETSADTLSSPLPPEGTTQSQIIGSTRDADALPPLQPEGSCGDVTFPNPIHSTWYSIHSPDFSIVRVTTCNAVTYFDAAVTIWRQDVDGEIECVDGRHSGGECDPEVDYMEYSTKPSTSYFIMVHSMYAFCNGEFQMDISTSVFVQNDPTCGGFGPETARIFIGGDETAVHGSMSGGVLSGGWKFLQDVIEILICSSVIPSGDGEIHVLGATPVFESVDTPGEAIEAVGVALGTTVNYYRNTSEIGRFFDTLIPGGLVPSVIYAVGTPAFTGVMPICCEDGWDDLNCGTFNDTEACICGEDVFCCVSDWAGNGCSNIARAAGCCPSERELAADLAAYATEIKQYTSDGGSFMAHGFSMVDWMGVITHISEQEICDISGAELTPDADDLFPGVTAADIQSTNCRWTYTAGFGGLKVVARDASGYPLMLGGQSFPSSAYTGYRLNNFRGLSEAECEAKCLEHKKCDKWSYRFNRGRPECATFTGAAMKVTKNGWLSGDKV